jgi:hypothetical protein
MSFTSVLPTPQILLKPYVGYRASESSDSARGIDASVSLVATFSAADSARVVETAAVVGVSSSDTAQGTELPTQLVNLIFGSDTASGVDSTYRLRAELSSRDLAVGQERVIQYGIPVIPSPPPPPPPSPMPPVTSGIDAQKWNLLVKTIGEPAPDIIRKRMIDISEVLNFDLFWNNLLALLAGLLSVSDFGFGLDAFDLFYANFRIRLPTLDELLSGIYIVIEPVTLEFDFSEYVQFDLGLYFDPSWSLDFQQTLQWFFKFDEMPAIAFPEGYQIIARFDITKYGEGVYCSQIPTVSKGTNPILSTDVGSALLYQTRYLSVTPWVVAQYAEMTGSYELGKAVVARIDFLEKVLKDALFLGFNMLGYTPIRSREVKNGQEGVTVHIAVDGRDVNVFVNSLDKITFGFILGVTPLGLGRFTPEETYTVFRNTAARYAWWRAMKQKELFVSQLSTLVHTVPPAEKESVYKSQRIMTYGVHRHLVEVVRSYIASLVPEADAFTQNKYFTAALEAIYKNRVVHARARAWKQKMSDEEFKQIWIEKWTAMGLNRDVLEDIYGRVVVWRKLAEQERREKPLVL